MKKNFLVIFFLVVAFALFAAGATEETEAEEKPVTLTYFQYKTEIIDELEELFKLFHERNPNVTIELETPSDYATVLKSRINANNLPDIYNVKEAGWKLERFIDREMILDLTDQEFIDRITDAAKPAVTHKDRIWALPMDLGAQGIIYNKELFEDAGIDNPPATVSE